MKAIVMTAAGSPSVLELREIPKPEIQHPTQLLIRLKAAGFNPIDTKLRQRGTFYSQEMPAILGCDGAGVVEAVGAEVTTFKPGDEVYFCAGGLGKAGTGNYAEYTIADQNSVALKPRSLSFAEAAAVPLALITAWESLYDRGRLEAGQTVLIQAGAGGVGSLAIQLAKLRGATVFTTVGTPDKERLVRQLGADHPILYQQTDFVEVILAETDGQGVDLAFDTVGGQTFFKTIPAVKIYGDLVTILEPNSALGSLKTARDRNLRISLELMLTPQLLNLTPALGHQADILKQSGQWFDEGRLQIHLSQTFTLEEAIAAHQSLETGHTTGKIALTID
jgi:NADPH2:quinone reductase